MPDPKIHVVQADLGHPDHPSAVIAMLDGYSLDPMGDQKQLSDFARENLIAGLRAHPTTLIFLAFDQQTPIGIAVCFRGFSTFEAKPLINLHDFFVASSHRGLGVASKLMGSVEQAARETGCCKLTLEVQTNNAHARQLYKYFGFAQSVYPADQHGGGSLFLAKRIVASDNA